MLLYVVFILLPATALARAECDREGYWSCFNAADTNKDGKDDLSECYALYNIFDADKNGSITVQEITLLAPIIAPNITGHEQALVDFIDKNGDGIISICDVFTDFKNIDTDLDGYKSEFEYTVAIESYCSQLEG